ncbi:hypothetical protein ACHWQZ_G008805 [Mnemiopsis leidyi]
MSAPIKVSAGVEKTVITPGTGAAVTRGATVTVHCTGMLTAGLKKFWSTHDPGQRAFTFKAGVGQVIQGWDEGTMTMCLGEKSRISMTGDKGYGSGGFPAWGIPPNAGLTFELEVISIQ